MIDKEPLEPRLHRYLGERDAERLPIGLEDRILRAVRDEPRRRRGTTLPGQVLAAASIVVVAVGLAAGVAYLRGHGTANRGPAPSQPSVGVSLGTQGGGDWVVIRGIDTGQSVQPGATNGLYHSPDGGQTWQDRFHFSGNYDGMSWSADGTHGVIWTRDMTRPCGTANTCYKPSNQVLTVYSTSDGGLHWVGHTPHNFGDPMTLTYFDGTNGWVLTRFDYTQGQAPTVAQLFKTTDAGATWTKVSDLPELTGMQLSGGTWGYTYGVGQTDLVFANAEHGWLATGLENGADNSSLLETTDGGKTWQGVSIQLPPGVSGEQAVLGYPVPLPGGRALLPVYLGHRTDPNTFAIDHRFIYSSTNSGSTWTNPVPLNANGEQPTGYEWQTFYLDSNRWWFTAVNARSAGEPVAQAGPAVARTTDGGKSWQVFKDKSTPTILQLVFTDSDHGWAMAISGPDNTNILLRTTDGGAHWHQVQVP